MQILVCLSVYVHMFTSEAINNYSSVIWTFIFYFQFATTFYFYQLFISIKFAITCKTAALAVLLLFISNLQQLFISDQLFISIKFAIWPLPLMPLMVMALVMKCFESYSQRRLR